LSSGTDAIYGRANAQDACTRFAAEVDFEEWRHNLQVYGLDFRDLSALQTFCEHIRAKYSRLDALVNNACQTIRRPPAYYSHMLPLERAPEKAATAQSILPLLASHASYERALQGGASRRLALAGLSPEEEARTSGDDAATTGVTDADVDIDTSASTSTSTSAGQGDAAGAADAVTIAIDGDVGGAGNGQGRTAAASAELSQVSVIAGDSAAEQHMGKEKDAATGAMVAAMDQSGQQVDLRKRNSWLLKLEEVSVGEAAEVLTMTNQPTPCCPHLRPLPSRTCSIYRKARSVWTSLRGASALSSLVAWLVRRTQVLAINTLAPFVLNAQLRKLMERSPDDWKFIVNVSAMEGKFYRFKTANHPHTNMAKAALNMMTRTSAQDYRNSGIFMTAVDTGWINDEKPLERAAAHEKRHAFQTPLDEVDAAARILDPILAPLAARDLCHGDEAAIKALPEPQYGVFLKDYMKTEW